MAICPPGGSRHECTHGRQAGASAARERREGKSMPRAPPSGPGTPSACCTAGTPRRSRRPGTRPGCWTCALLAKRPPLTTRAEGRGGAGTRAPGTPGRSQSQQRASPPRRPALPAPPSRPRGPTADGPFARRRRRWRAREASGRSRRAVQGQGRKKQAETEEAADSSGTLHRRAQGAGRRAQGGARGPLRVDGAGDEQIRQQSFREVGYRKERESRPRVLRRPAPAPAQPGGGGEGRTCGARWVRRDETCSISTGEGRDMSS